MRKFMYDEKTNTLYINTELIMPDLRNKSVRERTIAVREHFKLSMEDRILMSSSKDEILKEILKYSNVVLSEFTDL